MIRIYRDENIEGIISILKAIRSSIGEMSTNMEGLFDGVESSLKSGKLKEASSFAKQISNAGKSPKLSRVKTLASALIARLKTYSKENDSTPSMYQVTLLKAKPITKKAFKELQKIAKEEFIDPKEGNSVLENFISKVQDWQKWDKMAFGTSVEEAVKRAKDILELNKLYCKIQVNPIINNRKSSDVLFEEVFDGTKIDDLKKRFERVVNEYKQKHGIKENYEATFEFDGVKVEGKLGEEKKFKQIQKTHKLKAINKQTLIDEFEKLKKQYSMIANDTVYIGTLRCRIRNLNGTWDYDSFSEHINEKGSLIGANTNKETYFVINIRPFAKSKFAKSFYGKTIEINDKRGYHKQFTTKEEAKKYGEKYMEQEGLSGDILIYKSEKESLRMPLVEEVSYESKNSRSKILGERRAERNKREREEFEANKPKNYLEFEVGKSYEGQGNDPWYDALEYHPVFVILSRTNANVTAKITMGANVIYNNKRIKIRKDKICERLSFNENGYWYQCSADNQYNGGDTRDPRYDPNAIYTH